VSNASCYTAGECTWGAATLAPWIPCGLGNAITWLTYARAKGFATGTAPRAGAVVVYGPCCPGHYLYSQYGHCAVVLAVQNQGAFQVREMNFYGDGGGFDRYDTRVSSMEAVLGFIYPPSPPPPPPTPSQPQGRKVSTSQGSLLPAALLLLGGVAMIGYEGYRRPELRHRLGQVSLEQERRVAGALRSGEHRVVGWAKSI